ncbi:MAG: hotdog family protein [Planctomycetota bacterium]|jgi:3-hydroxyacyl-[acyl-carrier-protein] dehydratase
MKFDLIDHVIETGDDDSIVVVKQVSMAEEYLADHFPGFPILPGVMMIETMAQAARRLLQPRSGEHLVLGEVKALKFGAMVKPGERLEMSVTVSKPVDGGGFACKGVGIVRRQAVAGDTGDETAVSGRFTMRPLRQPQTAQIQGVGDGSTGDGHHDP